MADAIVRVHAGFDKERFIELVFEGGVRGLELKAMMRHTTQVVLIGTEAIAGQLRPLVHIKQLEAQIEAAILPCPHPTDHQAVDTQQTPVLKLHIAAVMRASHQILFRHW